MVMLGQQGGDPGRGGNEAETDADEVRTRREAAPFTAASHFLYITLNTASKF